MRWKRARRSMAAGIVSALLVIGPLGPGVPVTAAVTAAAGPVLGLFDYGADFSSGTSCGAEAAWGSWPYVEPLGDELPGQGVWTIHADSGLFGPGWTGVTEFPAMDATIFLCGRYEASGEPPYACYGRTTRGYEGFGFIEDNETGEIRARLYDIGWDVHLALLWSHVVVGGHYRLHDANGIPQDSWGRFTMKGFIYTGCQDRIVNGQITFTPLPGEP